MLLSVRNGHLWLPRPYGHPEPEKELQNLIDRHPSILDAVPRLNGQDKSLYIVARELKVSSGRLDFFAIDAEGSLYVIETKLAENPELRRAVIGQVMEYASNLRDMGYDTFRAGLSCDLETTLAEHFSDESEDSEESLSASEYERVIRANLEAGVFNIVVVTNNINFEIQKLFNYIDEVTRDSLNFIVLEVNKYDVGREIYIHSGVVWAAKYIRSLFSRKTIKESEYIKSKTPHVREIIAFIDEWCNKRELQKVQRTKGIAWGPPSGGSIFVSNDWLNTNWSTFKATQTETLKVTKARQLDLAVHEGFQVRRGKHGGMKVALDNSITIEIAEKFLNLSLVVIEKARDEFEKERRTIA